MADDQHDIGTVHVDIDADVHAAAEEESARTGMPTRLVLLRWILGGQHAEANQAAHIADQDLGPVVFVSSGQDAGWLESRYVGDGSSGFRCRECSRLMVWAFEDDAQDEGWRGRHTATCMIGQEAIDG